MDLQRVKEDADNGSLISTGTWRKVLAYALELERIGAEREIELSSILPSSYYMDLPDGGDITVIEQLRRMAEDAKSWRDCAASMWASPNWKSLNDVQWMNIMNHDRAFHDMSKDDAVHEAVKMTEAKLKELNASSAELKCCLSYLPKLDPLSTSDE